MQDFREQFVYAIVKNAAIFIKYKVNDIDTSSAYY